MYPSAYDFKSFYASLVGRIVRRVIREKIMTLWPTSSNLRVVGMGYATPYLRPFTDTADTVCALMPAEQGAHVWPDDAANMVALVEGSSLPLETNSVDRILMVHGVEFQGLHPTFFAEMWRVLKSSGRVMIIVPNRAGLWARADWTVFGQGTPFSASQIERMLLDNMFVHERTDHALFVPPIRSAFILRGTRYFEKLGALFCPALSGLHVVEASKQIYAGTGKRMTAGSRRPAIQKPAIVKPHSV